MPSLNAAVRLAKTDRFPERNRSRHSARIAARRASRPHVPPVTTSRPDRADRWLPHTGHVTGNE